MVRATSWNHHSRVVQLGPERGGKRSNGKLLANLPINSLKAAIEKWEWDAMRWKIGTFRKVLKSGCKAWQAPDCFFRRFSQGSSCLATLDWRTQSLWPCAETDRAGIFPVQKQRWGL